ncbi:hypothetical protein [Arthrobacter mobilis]|nr:hypothetical protein [Arthrobacter mobilis]
MQQPYEERSFQQAWLAGIASGPQACAGSGHHGCRRCAGPETD